MHSLGSAPTTAVMSAALQFSSGAKHHYYNGIKSKVIFLKLWENIRSQIRVLSPIIDVCHIDNRPVLVNKAKAVLALVKYRTTSGCLCLLLGKLLVWHSHSLLIPSQTKIQ